MKTHAPSESTPCSLQESKGRLTFAGSPFDSPHRPPAIKLAMTSGVTGASVPPAIAISVSPKRILVTASATASSPEGHAEETVAASAEIPILSAITLAAAWGIDAPDGLGASSVVTDVRH